MAAPPLRARVVADVADQRISNRIDDECERQRQARKRSREADDRRQVEQQVLRQGYGDNRFGEIAGRTDRLLPNRQRNGATATAINGPGLDRAQTCLHKPVSHSGLISDSGAIARGGRGMAQMLNSGHGSPPMQAFSSLSFKPMWNVS
jgi:hypothetical protein